MLKSKFRAYGPGPEASRAEVVLPVERYRACESWSMSTVSNFTSSTLRVKLQNSNSIFTTLSVSGVMINRLNVALPPRIFLPSLAIFSTQILSTVPQSNCLALTLHKERQSVLDGCLGTLLAALD